MSAMPTCPVCDNDALLESTHSLTIMAVPRDPLSGELTVDGLEGYSCFTCGADPVFPEQIRRNEEKIAAARAAHSAGDNT